MANLHRLEGNSPEIGGILFDFGGNLTKAASWKSPTPVADPVELAKVCTAQVLDSLMKMPSSPATEAAIRDTNWVSAVAGCAHHIREWNTRLRAHLNQVVDNIPLPSSHHPLAE